MTIRHHCRTGRRTRRGWLQPIDGKPARRLTAFTDQIVFDFAVSPDESALAVVHGPRVRDAQLITGFGTASAPATR